jgi:hypothetical protein
MVKKEVEETLSLQKCDGYLDLRAFRDRFDLLRFWGVHLVGRPMVV